MQTNKLWEKTTKNTSGPDFVYLPRHMKIIIAYFPPAFHLQLRPCEPEPQMNYGTCK